MCCFSGPVASVRNTRIFARLGGGGTQFLAYQMEYSSEADENAMILPLPVRTPATEASVRFIDLGGYSNFFDDLESGFPVKPPLSLVRSKGVESAVASAAPQLAVQEVGEYVASFVPSMKDFERLDPRFRISPDLWAKIPVYADYGFAVFQLKSREGRPHPMAFELTTRLAGSVYFPTVHIHDGKVHEEESFDHAIYLQAAAFDAVVGDYEDHDVADVATGFVRSDRPAGELVKVGAANGLVDGALLVHKRELKGTLPNEDQLVGMPQASIVPLAVRRNVWPYGPLAIAGVGVGWIIARRRKLNQRA